MARSRTTAGWLRESGRTVEAPEDVQMALDFGGFLPDCY
jgi:hypothetical protein